MSTFDMRYKHVEDAVAKAFGVEPAQMGAFRGRLRYLRSHGVPRLPAPGSGTQISYTRGHAIELMVALELECLGTPPSLVASVASDMARRSQRHHHAEGDDMLFALFPSASPFHETTKGLSLLQIPGVHMIPTMLSGLRRPPDSFSVVNASALIRRLDAALKATT
jgi:hypothetical protein